MTDRNDDLTYEWFSDPVAARQRITAELYQEYELAKQAESFWEELERRHPDLRGRRTLLRATYEDNADSLGGMSVADGLDALAGLARQQLRGGGGLRRDRDAEERAVMRGGPEDGSTLDEVPAPIGSLGDLIAARRAARQRDPGATRDALEGIREQQNRRGRERAARRAV